ncbi:MAG: hypothetical protein AMJ88_13505 [Anaerolineae bacterium SM23_ 63]|nr:MAG: hypothetical protein AMJ88_13505 [Anaerolineae bacterium SM23_ 63]
MDKKVMLNEVLRLSRPQPPGPDEFGWREYRDHLESVEGLRLCRKSIQDRLNSLVEKNILTKRQTIYKGKQCLVYRLVEQSK